jgi:hypothetical protein
MKRILVLLAICALFLPSLTMGVEATESPPVGWVRVEYYGAQGWAATMQSLVAEQNAVTRIAGYTRAPWFFFVDKPLKGCGQMEWPVPDRVFQVCTDPNISGANGLTWSNLNRQAALIQIENSAATWAMMRDVMCHEWMHATAGVPDGPFDYPNDSCVRGYLDHLGNQDIQWQRIRWA